MHIKSIQPKRILINFVINLIKVIRPMLGPAGCCKFETSCTQFAKEEFASKSFFIAIKNIVIRILSCNPLYKNR